MGIKLGYLFHTCMCAVGFFIQHFNHVSFNQSYSSSISCVFGHMPEFIVLLQ